MQNALSSFPSVVSISQSTSLKSILRCKANSAVNPNKNEKNATYFQDISVNQELDKYSYCKREEEENSKKGMQQK
jgi:hypothetical protein